MRENADVIWVFVESEFCFALLDSVREFAVFAAALHITVRAIADSVWARVHAPLIGVSVFSVALV